jgi:K+-transporting ATPase ATPase C chain
MLKELKYSLKAIAIFTVMLGLVYPGLITVFSLLLFPQQANGSLIKSEGRIVGSKLIGQNFSSSSHFHPRPSKAGTDGYDAMASGGSNLAPTNNKLIEDAKANLKKILNDNPGVKSEDVPIDAVTSSASGLDPHISIQNALMQAQRIAKARNLDISTVRYVINNNTDTPLMFIQGEPGVNVLLLNIELDRIAKDIEKERK